MVGSNDGVEWTQVDARAAEAWPTRFFAREFRVAATGRYRTSRLRITENYGSRDLQLALWTLYTKEGAT